MRTLKLTTAIIAAVVIAGSSFAQELSSQTEEQQKSEKSNIEKLLTAQKEAWNQGKLENFMETYWKSEKLTFSAGGITTRGWQATLDRYKKRYSTPAQMGQLNFDGLEIELLQTQSALVLGNWHLTMQDNSKRDGNFSLVLAKVQGVWKIVHDHSSELKQP
jgi:beta-aspartyl-peptidase (threonine type)